MVAEVGGVKTTENKLHCAFLNHKVAPALGTTLWGFVRCGQAVAIAALIKMAAI